MPEPPRHTHTHLPTQHENTARAELDTPPHPFFPPPTTAEVFSGNGYERNANGAAGSTSWAQPSGLSLSPGGDRLYVADSESSTVRGLSLGDRSSVSFVGGDSMFADNLFRWGEAGWDARVWGLCMRERAPGMEGEGAAQGDTAWGRQHRVAPKGCHSTVARRAGKGTTHRQCCPAVKAAACCSRQRAALLPRRFRGESAACKSAAGQRCERCPPALWPAAGLVTRTAPGPTRCCSTRWPCWPWTMARVRALGGAPPLPAAWPQPANIGVVRPAEGPSTLEMSMLQGPAGGGLRPAPPLGCSGRSCCDRLFISNFKRCVHVRCRRGGLIQPPLQAAGPLRQHQHHIIYLALITILLILPWTQWWWRTRTTTASSCWTPPAAASPRWRAAAAPALPTAAPRRRSCRSPAGCAGGRTVRALRAACAVHAACAVRCMLLRYMRR